MTELRFKPFEMIPSKQPSNQPSNHSTKSIHLTNKLTSPKRRQFTDRSNQLYAKREQETFKKKK
jgi:hypothetical protein